jgi:primosomal protein N''
MLTSLVSKQRARIESGDAKDSLETWRFLTEMLTSEVKHHEQLLSAENILKTQNKPRKNAFDVLQRLAGTHRPWSLTSRVLSIM